MELDKRHSHLANEAQLTVTETARAWLVRLRDDDVSIEEIAEWQNWLAQSPDHSRAYERVEKTWQVAAKIDLDGLEPTLAEIASDTYMGETPIAFSQHARADTAIADTPSQPQHFTNSASGLLRRGPIRTAVAAATAGAALLFALAVSLPLLTGDTTEETTNYQDTGRQIVATISTAKAEHRTANLFDGTDVAVGAASQISVDFSQKERRVDLTSGEAYFDVAPDPERPFVVSTPLGDVTAVGTAFNVRLASNRVVVTVTEGKVDVRPATIGVKDSALQSHSRPHPDGSAVRVEAGSAFTIARHNNVATPMTIVPALDVSWQDHRLVYRAEPLQYVIADINRYTPGRIEYADPAVGQLSYSGVISPDAIEDWAMGLAMVFPVEIDNQPGGTIRIRARSSE